MHRLVKFGMLAAVLALCASPVRAGFAMGFADNPTGDGFTFNVSDKGVIKVGAVGSEKLSDITVKASNTATNDYTVIAMIDGYTVRMHAAANNKSGPTTAGVIYADITITGGADSKGTNWRYYADATPFTSPAPMPLFVQAQVITDKNPANFTPGSTAQALGQVGFGPGTTTSTVVLKSAGQSAYSNLAAIASPSGSYQLGNIGGSITTGGPSSNTHFVSQVVTSLPEPTGVLIGLLGVPFMAGLVFVSRRRTAVVAA